MSDREHEPPLPQSDLTAEQLLTRLLELIMSSASNDDFTVASVSRTLGVPLETYAPDKWGGRARLTPEWNYAITALNDPHDGTQFRFAFYDNDGGMRGDMSQICRPDFDDFTGALRSAHFTKKSVYGEHGELVFDSYTRDRLRVEVVGRGEAGVTDDKVLHQCVQSITVR